MVRGFFFSTQLTEELFVLQTITFRERYTIPLQ